MANFPGLVLTTAGRNLQAKAQIGAALQFTRVALGDGTSTAPDAMIALDNERLSLSIQEFEVVGDGTSRMRVIMTNEALTSGFFVRELGVFAEDPDTGEEQLYSYSNAGDQPDFLPAGGGATLVENVFDLYTVVGNAQNVTAKINDYITIATKQDIDVIRPLLMPEGGTTHQLPRKRSNEEGDVEWFDPAEGVNIAVDSLEERRVAVAEQQTFRLTLVTTRGLAVYINGQRLPRSGWTPLGETQVRINEALNAGDEVLFVRNEEMGEIVIPRVSLAGPSLVYPGSTNTFLITDFDAFANYEIAVTRGEVSRSGDTITLTLEPEEQDGALDLNVTRDGAGITYEIAVGEQTIATPQWAYPGMNDTGVPLLPTLQSTPFRTYPRNADQHASSDWQIATDAEFNQVVWESLNDSDNLASITITEALPINTPLHARHRQTGQQLGTTEWQTVAFRTTNSAAQPVITSPQPDEEDVTFHSGIMITASAFNFPGGGDNHIATDWELRATGSSELIASLTNSGAQLTTWRATSPELAPFTEYEVRVRYRAATTGPTPWSAWSRLTTGAGVGEVIYDEPGEHVFTVPYGVTSLSAVAVGGGGGGMNDRESGSGAYAGAGGGLRYINDVPVEPGQQILVMVGAGGSGAGRTGLAKYGGTSSFGEWITATGGRGGTAWGAGDGEGGDGGGRGGYGHHLGAAGGAAGYSGDGGNGHPVSGSPSPGEGGGGGGGFRPNASATLGTGGGGGVGLLGEGESGSAGTSALRGGRGGSGGENGGHAGLNGGNGGKYGGGGGLVSRGGNLGGHGGVGAVRIIWGPNRSFPFNAEPI